MNSERWEKIKELLHEALDRDPSQQRDYLIAQCGEDKELLRDTLELLSSHQEAGQFLFPLSLPHDRLGDWELLEEIGSGSAGVVYAGRHKRDGRPAAVKVMRHFPGISEVHVRAFLKDAERASTLDHPHVVKILDVGRDDGTPYIVMDLCAGGDLASALREDREKVPQERRWSDHRRCARLLLQVAEALEHTHAARLIHRDVKPSNVLLDEQGQAYLADFGSARETDRGTLTWGGGTPCYMSPEQARARQSRIDHRTDIYSLGVVAYELLTQTRPFDGDTSDEIFSAIRHHEPPRLRKVRPEVPRDLETICLKAMRKEVSQRYTSASAFAEDLRRFLAHDAPLAQPPTLLESLLPFYRRHRRMAQAVTAVLVVAVVAFAADWWATERLLDQRLDALTLTVTAGEVEFMEPREARDHARSLRALAAEIDSLRQSGLQDGRLQRAEAEMLAVAEALRGRATRGIAAGPQGLDTMLRFAVDDDSDAWIAVLSEVGGLTSNEPNPDTGLQPRVSLDSRPPGALVRAWRAHPITGEALAEPVDLGVTPLQQVSIARGYYRIVIGDAGGPSGELFCLIPTLLDEIELPTVSLRPTDEVTEGMVRVPGGEMIPEEGFPDRSQVSVLPFWIDPFEVTNGEYREFALETGCAAPRHWPKDWQTTWSDQWNALPVSYVDVKDAEAYAAWIGKRLPTAAEWSYAARGSESYPYPWGTEVEGAPQRANVKDSEELDPLKGVFIDSRQGTDENRWLASLQVLTPVGSQPDDRSPFGVYDVLGNVREWTASPSIHSSTGLAPNERVSAGGSCRFALDLTQRTHPPVFAKDLELGFRCARRLTPR